jgi:hypothetical protein
MIPVRILLWLILLEQILPGTCVFQYVPRDTTAFEGHLLKAIVNISLTYFTNDSPLLILTSDAWYKKTLQNKLGDSVFREIHAVTSWPVLTLGTNSNARVGGNTAEKHGAAIFLLNGEDFNYEIFILQNMLMTLGNFSLWNPRAFYFIASTFVPHTAHSQHTVADFILKKFADSNIFKVILLIQEPVQINNSEIRFKPFSIDIFTLSLHGPEKKYSKFFKVTFLDRWVSGEERTRAGFRNNAKLFRSKPVTDLQGLNITVHYSAWAPLVMSSETNDSTRSTPCDEGLEVRIMKTVAEKTNFSFDFQVAKKNIAWQATFGAQWMQTNLLAHVDATWTHFTGALTWFVPREREIPSWQSLIKIFNPSCWLLVFLSYLLGSIIFWVLGNTQSRDKETASFRSITLIFMNTLGMILSESVYNKPRHTRSQIFFFLWCFYCMQVNTAYQSSLIGFLTNPGHLSRIYDVDSLLESGLELGIQNGSQHLFGDASDPRNKRVLKALIECDEQNIDMCLNRMAYDGDLAVAAGRVGLEFLAHTKYMKNGKPLFVPFKDNIKHGYMVVYLKKGSILLERINSIVLRLQNAGIIDKWVNDIRRKFGKHFDNASFEDGVCVLTVAHLQGAFYLLLFGVIVSVTIWLLEIMHHLLGRSCRKKC